MPERARRAAPLGPDFTPPWAPVVSSAQAAGLLAKAADPQIVSVGPPAQHGIARVESDADCDGLAVPERVTLRVCPKSLCGIA
jgi:hypothetical protein